MQLNNAKASSHITEEVARKKINELNLINGFLFDSVLEDQDDAIKVIQAILTTTFNRTIKVVNVTSQKSYNGIDTYLHGIRFDAKITPENDGSLIATIYDVEMEDRDSDKSELPKRLRYYTAISDDKHVKSGNSYLTLPDFVTVTISSYDPFDADSLYYEARTVLTTHPHIEYKDGLLHIFLYCKGKVNKGLDVDHGKKLTEMLKYILSGEKPLTPNTDIETIDDIITQVKKKPEVTINYMKQWDREEHLRRDILREVRQEVRQEVHQEVLQEVRQETKSEDALVFIYFGRSNSIPDDNIRTHLETKMQLSPEVIDDLFKRADAEKEALLAKQ